jgi:hypothetical protein
MSIEKGLMSLRIKWCTRFGDIECRLDARRGKHFKIHLSLCFSHISKQFDYVNVFFCA